MRVALLRVLMEPSLLTVTGGFAILDEQQRRLHQRARAHGYIDLDGYLAARGQQQTSLTQLASELGTTTPIARRLRDHAGLALPPRHVTAARTLRHATDHKLATRAAQLGFASLEAYLADRALTRSWPSTQIASELGVHPATVRDRLDRHRLPRQRATARPRQATQRQLASWAAKRQARLTALGFPDIEGYLRTRRVAQGWSLRRMAAELHLAPSWLKSQIHRLGIL